MTFEDWLHGYQGLRIDPELDATLQSRIDKTQHVRTMAKQIKEVLDETGRHDISLEYVLDHYQGRHIEPFDAITEAQVLQQYDELSLKLQSIPIQFPFVYILKKCLEQLGFTELAEKVFVPKVFYFDRMWATYCA